MFPGSNPPVRAGRSRGPLRGAMAASLLLSMTGLQAAGALAMMAGASPDTPAARVDANVASSPYAGVGAVVVGGVVGGGVITGGTVCSGVVIAPQYVLTAAHVVAGAAPGAIAFQLNTGGSPWIATASAVTYPGYSFPYDDLAVLQLSAPVPAGVPVYPLYSGARTAGLTLILVGYGASGNGDVGVSIGAAAGVKRVGRNVADELTTQVDTSGLTSSFFIYDFDGPSGNGPLGGRTLGNAVETMVADGDSGSPAFVQVGGSLQLFGINSFVSTTVQGQPITYTFGQLGGGIVAADPRFAPWLQAVTGSGGDGSGPLPPWSLAALGMLLAALALTARPARAARHPPAAASGLTRRARLG